ncbi:cardiolipin synthase [uncultured Porticoccus sp.]|mgnify:FL=1|uniref:cardiolipin synthase n=1 Tax=uncultured Porticoccus sp. TaxID=1256050 RepID=UPI0030DAC373
MGHWLWPPLVLIGQGWQWIGEFWLPVYILTVILGTALAIEAIFKARTTQGAIAWSLGLIFLPPLVVPVYLLFGQRRFYGYVEARRKGDLEIQRIAQKLLSEMTQDFSLPGDAPAAVQLLEQLALMPFTRGNRVSLLINGEQIFERIFAAIDGAEDYILVQFYIVRDDRLGNELLQRLAAKARQGVRVYFLFDAIGSFKLTRRYLRVCRDAGITIESFRTWRWRKRRRFQINFRNHRKVVVVDGRCAFVGGANLGDEYRHHHLRLKPWRDTHVQLEGPAVKGTQVSFLEDWYWATGDVPAMNWHPESMPNDQQVLVLPSGPADLLDSCQLMFLHAINSARERIWIVSPYFVPDESISNALKLAALRGVDVRLMLPGITDNRLVQLSSYAALMDMQYAGIQAFQYQRGFLHQKVVLVDSDRAYVGTANFDNRSFHLNFEITLMVRDWAFAREVETMLLDDFSGCRPLTVESLEKRSLIFLLLTKLARLFSPIQ